MALTKLKSSGIADGAVTASDIAANSITVAQMSRAGTSGQVLTSAGTGADSAWAAAAGGKVLQVVSTSYSTNETTTSATLSNTSLAVAITPASASNKVLILLSVPLKSGRNSSFTATSFQAIQVAITRGVTEVYVNHGLGVGANFGGATGYIESNWSIAYLDSPSTTSATTYTFQIASTRTDFTTTSCQGDKLGNIIAMEIAA
jgi:hypothetical protein